jgi:lipoprotein-anchoring transpeptidase ErfK/SrfK
LLNKKFVEKGRINMNKKIMALGFSMVLGVSILSGCSSKAPAATPTTAPATTTAPAPADTVTSASQVNDEATFEQKISKDNTDYMVIVNKDLTFTNDLTVVSGVKKDKDGKDAPNRSIAPAAEDANQTITARYTITVPNLVMSGENEKIEYGIISGDVYVQAAGFTLKDATINGNLYFATDDLKNAFKQDATTKITGTIGVKTYTAK